MWRGCSMLRWQTANSSSTVGLNLLDYRVGLEGLNWLRLFSKCWTKHPNSPFDSFRTVNPQVPGSSPGPGATELLL